MADEQTTAVDPPAIAPIIAPPEKPAPKADDPAHGEPKIPVVTLHADDLKAMQKELLGLKEYRSRIEAETAAKSAEAVKLAAEKANAVKELEAYQAANDHRYKEANEKYQNLEREVLEEKRNVVIVEALAGFRFRGDGPEGKAATALMVRQLLERDVEAARDSGGKVNVRDKTTFRPAIDWLKEQLASPKFAIFLEPQGKGGSGADGTRTAPRSDEPNKPGSLESIAEDFKNRQNVYGSFGLHPISKN